MYCSGRRREKVTRAALTAARCLRFNRIFYYYNYCWLLFLLLQPSCWATTHLHPIRQCRDLNEIAREKCSKYYYYYRGRFDRGCCGDQPVWRTLVRYGPCAPRFGRVRMRVGRSPIFLVVRRGARRRRRNSAAFTACDTVYVIALSASVLKKGSGGRRRRRRRAQSNDNNNNNNIPSSAPHYCSPVVTAGRSSVVSVLRIFPLQKLSFFQYFMAPHGSWTEPPPTTIDIAS